VFARLKEIFSDSLFYGLSTVIGQLAGLVLVPYFTMELTPSDYGLLNMVTLVVVFLSPVAGLAMDTALFRFFSMEEDEIEKGSYFTTASIVKTTGVFALALILLPFYKIINASLFEGQLSKDIYYLIIGSFIVENFSSLSAVVLRSQRKVKLIAFNSILYVFVSISVSVFFVLILHLGVFGSLVASFIAGFFKMFLYIKITSGIFVFNKFDLRKAKALLRYSLPLVPHKIQGNIIGLFTTFMVNQKLGIVYSGYYAVASKVAKPLVFVVTMVQQSWTPYKFHIHKTDTEPAKSFSDVIAFYWVFLIFLWVLLSLATPILFKILIDKRYVTGVNYVPFIMFISVAQAIYFTITTGFELKKNQRKMVLASFLGTVFLVSSSLLTINIFAPYSFFIGQALSFFVLAAVIYPEARRLIIIDYPIVKTSVFLLAGVTTIGVGYIFNNLVLYFACAIVFIILTIAQFKWIFPQYPLKLILTKFKLLKRDKP
jgi:O-antigen/teichoic acid export membrane protein